MEIPSSVMDFVRDAPDEIRDASNDVTFVTDFAVSLPHFRAKNAIQMTAPVNKL